MNNKLIGTEKNIIFYNDEEGSGVGSFFSSTAEFDAAGNVMLGIRKDGSFFASSVVIDGIPTREESMTFLYAIIDRNRNVLWGIMKSGRVYQPKGIPEEVSVELDKIKRSLNSLALKVDNKENKDINNKFLDKVSKIIKDIGDMEL